MVLKDEVLKGLRFELSRDEIRKIYQSDSYEKYDYYDFSVLIKGIEKTINNEIEFDKKINYCFMDVEEYEDAFSNLFDDNWAENHNIIF